MPWAVRYCRRRFSRTGSGTSSAPSSAAAVFSTPASSAYWRHTAERFSLRRLWNCRRHSRAASSSLAAERNSGNFMQRLEK